MNTIKRLVLNFPGFETTGAVHQIDRLTAGGHKTAELWGFELDRGKIEEKPNSHKWITQFNAKGEEWETETRYVHFSWADIIAKYEETPYPQNLIFNFPKYFAFFLDGTVRKYAKASRRYWGFTIYPILLMLLYAAVSWFAVWSLLSDFDLHWLFKALPALGLFLVFCKWPGDRFYINLSINDWAFARDMCNGKNEDVSKRYIQFAETLIDEIRKRKPDEIVIVGHSFGSVWAVASLAIALEKNPRLLKNKRVTFLALGSSLLKIGLCKRAKFFHAAVHQVLGVENLVWHEIQTKTDFISFYKSDPFEPMKIVETPCEVITHRVNFKKALSTERHKKMLKSMYLAHRQYILYCDQRVHHDFQLRVFGPFFADAMARDPELAFKSELITPRETT
ncbi:MAG: hypothetical protein AAF217_08640 [Pseudomonadota bacterium]